jgi:aspartyl-tRNA(Asn)/glutamyl-tRNA(Gln) amidotransferase subunit B
LEIKSKTENQNAFKSQFSSTNFQSNSKFQFSNTKKIRIRRVHLEEDTAKLIHTKVEGEKACLIDFNRSGVPLVEVVTEPDFEATAQVDEFLKKLQLIVRYLGISSADMEKGSMRLEPNISVRKPDEKELPSYKVEVKNINSFRFVRNAIEYEIKRQTELLEKGQKPIQENRGWNETKKATVSQREKEEAHDYRYFPEPDIPPMSFDKISIRQLADQIPELPDEKIKRFVVEYNLSEYNAEILCQEKSLADYFEKAVRSQKLEAKEIANWIVNKKPDIVKVSPEELIKTIAQSQQVFEISDEDLEKAVAKVMAENPKAVEDYKKGKIQVLGFLIGKVVSATNTQIDKKLVQEKLSEALTKED